MVTSPILSASLALMLSPDRISSKAFCRPSILGKSTDAGGGYTPSLISGCPSFAFSEATAMSQPATISQPPPSASPLTRAMVGLSTSISDTNSLWKTSTILGSLSPRWSPTATPAEKALSPEPVMATTFTSSSSFSSASAWLISSRVTMSRMFKGGRLMVIVAAPSFFSSRMFLKAIVYSSTIVNLKCNNISDCGQERRTYYPSPSPSSLRVIALQCVPRQ